MLYACPIKSNINFQFKAFDSPFPNLLKYLSTLKCFPSFLFLITETLFCCLITNRVQRSVTFNYQTKDSFESVTQFSTHSSLISHPQRTTKDIDSRFEREETSFMKLDLHCVWKKKRKKWKLFFSPLQHKHEKHQKINWIDLKLEINWKKRKTWNKLKSTNKKCWKNNFYLFRWQSMNDMFSNNFGWLLFTRVIG